MVSHSPVGTPDLNNPLACKIGFWTALAAFIGTLGFSIAQILQIAAVLHFPWDAILILPESVGMPDLTKA
jgi:hypothetical protein